MMKNKTLSFVKVLVMLIILSGTMLPIRSAQAVDIVFQVKNINISNGPYNNIASTVSITGPASTLSPAAGNPFSILGDDLPARR